jgi:DNA-directed RNA polymerase specialized sigma24 family protein
MREGLLDRVDGREEFDEFVRAVEPRLRRALVAAYGSERGREATAEALGWAWEHRSKLDSIEYPVAFLYRVAQSRSRPRKTRVLFERDVTDDLWIEPKLAGALQSLTEGQRLAVLMVYGAGWTQVELADLLNVRPATVQKRLDRAMRTLRSQLEGEVRESK